VDIFGTEPLLPGCRSVGAEGRISVGLVFLFMAGGILGWLAAIITQADHRRGVLLNAAVGILGSLIAGLVLTPLLGGGNLLTGAYDVRALLIALAGSAGLLLVVNLLRPDAVR
jgi:uncharacterized membrane protein YeaQ/YmgE (transglycosylase-associated protein family)